MALNNLDLITMNIKHVNLIIAAMAVAVGTLSGCGKTDDAGSAEKAALAASNPAAASKPAAAESSGNVVVAPVSKIASAPGIDPMNAKTLPPMPAAARASAPASSAGPNTK